VSAEEKFCLFHAGDTRPCELDQQLGFEFDGIISSDDFSVYNGYPAGSQQKCLAHLRRHFKKWPSWVMSSTQPWDKFLDLIDEAFTQHRQWRETQDASAYQNWSGFSNPEHPAMDWPDTRRVSYYDRYGIKPNSGGTSMIQRCHRTTTRQSAPFSGDQAESRWGSRSMRFAQTTAD